MRVNLGHARLPDMLRALRISRASEAAIRACKLFRRAECPRLMEPKIPRPSKLPVVDEFGVLVGLDVFEAKDADATSWIWLNILDIATTFQLAALLERAQRNLISADTAQAIQSHWVVRAGLPEKGVIVDQTIGIFLEGLRERWMS